MEERICENCRHFHQHYVPIGTHYIKAYCGHCTSRRIRHSKPDKAACERFAEKKSYDIKQNSEKETVPH